MFISKKLKFKIINFLRRLGYELHKTEYIIKAEREKIQWLENLKIKTVLDIGANEGQFAKYIHEILPEARIYSFEPLQDCYEQLNFLLGGFSNFKAFNFALGSKAEECIIHRSNFSQSSSLLPMLEHHERSFPFSKGGWEERIQVVPLDDLENDLILEKPILIKMDVQGFEDKVIDGGSRIIGQAEVLFVELSMTPLYKGQLLFYEMYQMIRNLGFEYQGNLLQYHSAIDGRVVQVDGIFVKNKL